MRNWRLKTLNSTPQRIKFVAERAPFSPMDGRPIFKATCEFEVSPIAKMDDNIRTFIVDEVADMLEAMLLKRRVVVRVSDDHDTDDLPHPADCEFGRRT